MRYDDFDLQIEPAGNRFRVRLLNAPTGQATTEFALPFTEIEVANFLSRIGQVRRTMRRVDAPELQAAKEFGGKLFGAVFSGEMIAQLRGSMEQASDKEHGLRIRLRLTDVPALADLPWEFLYDANQNHFLTTSSETPVVRFLDLPQRIAPLRVALPLRVLVMIASPRNLKRLDTEGEWTRLQESLADLLRGGQIRLERLSSATLDALRLRARGTPFHVFHFIGHGGFDEAAQDGVLQFEDESGMSYPVRGELVGMQLHDHRSLRLAVLNACEGARSSRQDPFSGVAQSLLQQRVPAVIAMQFEISDAAAKVFASEFYRAVAEGNPVDAAVCESRKALFKEEFGQEWATPVLYMRSQEGQLFELQAVAAPPLPDDDLRRKEIAEAERHAAEQAEAERATKVEKELQARQRAEQERSALAKAEAERKAAEKAETERQAAAKAEAERQAAEKAEAAARAEKERLEREKAQQERLAREKAEAERRAVEISEELAEQAMREGSLIREKLRAGIRAAEQARAEAAARAEKDRLALEKTAQQDQAREKAESESQAATKVDADRAQLVLQKEEAEHRAKEQAAYQRLQREKGEADRLAHEQAVAGNVAAHRGAAERVRPSLRVWLLIIAIPTFGLGLWLARVHFSRNPESHYVKGEALRDQKNFDAAIAEYREAIRLQPNYSAAHFGLAIAFRDKSDFDDAATEFREVIRESPNDVGAHEALGLTLFRKGDFDGAMTEYREAIRLNPQEAQTHYRLANALEKKGDHDAAIAEYRETLRLKPDFAQTHSMPALPAIAKTEKANVPETPVSPAPVIKPPVVNHPPARIHVGGNVQAAKIVNRVKPTYPPLAVQARISGTVQLHAIITRDGTVREVDAISGHPLLLQSAMNAVKQWRYKPTLLNGRPAEVDTTIDVEFNLAGVAPNPGPEPKVPNTSTETSSTATASPPAAKSPCTFGKIEFSEQGNRLVGSVPYTYQGSYSLDAVALRGIPLNKNKQQIPGLSYQQSTLKTATGTAPFAVEGQPTLNHKEEESVYLIISIVVKQTNAIVCGELVPYQRKW
jgi:TonB family protein